MENKKIFDLIVIPLKLLLICSLIALLVAGVNSLTADIIKENEEKKTNESLNKAFPDSVAHDEIGLPLERTPETECVVSLYKAMGENGEIIGYAILSEPMGFKDIISLIVAFEPDGAIRSVDVVSSSETMKKEETSGEAFISQFNDKSGVLELKKDIDAVSGATISSKAILDGVNAAIIVFESEILGGAVG